MVYWLSCCTYASNTHLYEEVTGFVLYSFFFFTLCFEAFCFGAAVFTFFPLDVYFSYYWCILIRCYPIAVCVFTCSVRVCQWPSSVWEVVILLLVHKPATGLILILLLLPLIIIIIIGRDYRLLGFELCNFIVIFLILLGSNSLLCTFTV